ncbi:MAG: type II toxin-antitoxin system RelE/ParE family toxin [Candidatus Melainabacteria bacterium]|nr:type II toxin-antitoxin system RelE/ParE family toxin [Candidatus Melainabacteria bacterium]
MDTLLNQQQSRKKTGPKPLYGEAKKMVSFRLSPRALEIIRHVATQKGVSQAEVIEQWARLIGSNADSLFTQKTEAVSELVPSLN